jgi:hypothetical protein
MWDDTQLIVRTITEFVDQRTARAPAGQQPVAAVA